MIYWPRCRHINRENKIIVQFTCIGAHLQQLAEVKYFFKLLNWILYLQSVKCSKSSLPSVEIHRAIMLIKLTWCWSQRQPVSGTSRGRWLSHSFHFGFRLKQEASSGFANPGTACVECVLKWGRKAWQTGAVAWWVSSSLLVILQCSGMSYCNTVSLSKTHQYR